MRQADRRWLRPLLLAVTLWLGVVRAAGAVDALDTRVLTPPQLQPQGDMAYLAQLQARAKDMALAQDAAWLTLLHYAQQPLTRHWRSLADDADFFNAPDGKTDAQAELEQTLAAFFDPRANRSGEQAARCRFAARWAWLSQRLAIDAERLPAVSCEAYDAWRRSLQARSVTMVFPAAYVNSPASMYGHTFLRLNLEGADADQPLLAYTISYAAEGVDQGGFLFALKGLVGLYPGIVSNAPYYVRIREYTHLENRDIWEYDLSLTPAEIDRLMAHAWELGHTRFDYYFFDENCSYQLLTLLDAARPGLGLSTHFTWWTIPVDTVRVMAEVPGLVAARRYRPSNSSELRYRALSLSEADRQRAMALAAGEDPKTLVADDDQRLQTTRTLELAERLAVWRASRGELDDDGLARIRTPLLALRARRAAAPELTVPEPAYAPEQGHRTARLDLSAGTRNGQAVSELTVRASYHDVMDPEAGYQRGAQIQFGSLTLMSQAGRGLRLEQFTPVDILSLAPQSAVGGGPSWKVRFGVSRAWGLTGEHTPLAWGVNGGPGKAWELGAPDAQGRDRAMAYLFLDNQLWRDSSRAVTPWRLGSGLQAGVLVDPAPTWRVQLDALERHFIGPGGREQALSLQSRWSLGVDDNLVARCDWQRRDRLTPVRQCLAGWQRYW